MWIELLQEQIKQWNNLSEINKEIDDTIRIKWAENGKPLNEQDLDFNLIHSNQPYTYEIRLETKTELFHKASMIYTGKGRVLGFEQVAKMIIESTIMAGFLNNIRAIRNMMIEQPQSFPNGRFTGG